MSRIHSHRLVRRIFANTVAIAVFAGIFASMPASSAATTAGTALQFNGSNQYVTYGAAPALGAATFTLETWFRRTGAGIGTSTGSGGIASAIPLLTKGRAEAEGSNVDMNYFLGIDATSGKLVADFEEGAGTGGTLGLNHPVSGNTVITSNVWHHAAATYDGQTWRLYLDGAQDGTLTLAAPRPPRSDSIQHAALATAMTSTGVAAGFFQGVLDEARVWNVARSGAQIQSTMTSEIASPTPGLLGRWGMNEGSGTVVGDSAGSTTGTAVNGPTWTSGFPIPDTTPPTAPQNLASTPGNGVVSLTWNANAEPDLAGYNVYRSTSTPVSTSGTPLNGSLLTSTSYLDATVANGVTYFYAVVAVDTSANASAPSNESSASPAASLGNGLQFNGSNQYVTFGAAPGLDAPAFTLETWFKRTGAGVGTSTGSGGIASAIPLITKGRAEAEGSNVDMNYFLGIDATTGKLVADFEDMASGQNHPVTGGTTVTSNVWHHAAATYDGQTWTLYLDGAQDATLTLASATAPRSDSIQHATLATAMNSTGVAAGFFQGVMDEARIWNVARSASQIQAGSSKEISSATRLIGRWGMNQSSGTVVTDSSGGGTNGTATNGAAWVPGYQFPTDTAPAAPQGLSATAGNAMVSLSWTANTEGDLAGYNVYRATSSPVPTTSPVNGSTLITSTTYDDTGLVNGQTYYYVVTAVDDANHESAASNEASTTPVAPPPSESALQFNGSSQHVTFGPAPALGASAFTLETWFKRTGAGVGTNTGNGGIASAIPLITKGRAEAEGSNVDMNYFFGIDATTGTLVADFEDMATGQNHPVTGSTVVSSNVWHHAAVTYDGQTWTLYLDGVRDATLTLAAPTAPRSDSIQHAALATAMNSTGVAAGFFQGMLDESRIWNVARSERQIRATRDTALSSGGGLIGRWGMSEGSGTVLHDSTGSTDGSLVGGPAWVPGYGFPQDTTSPSAPANLTATPGDATVGLTWDANAEPDLAGYDVYRSTGTPVDVNGTPLNGATLLQTTSYMDTGVTNGTTYHYAVVAVDGANNASAPSAEATATPQAAVEEAHALQFNGTNQYVTFGAAPGLGTATFTLETWFKRTGPGVGTSTGTGGVTAIPLITKGRAEAENSNVDMNYFLGIDASTGKLVADFEEGGSGTTPGLNHPVSGATLVNSDVWHHAAATYDGTTWKIYLDGQLDGQLTVGQPPRANSIQHAALATAMNSTGVAAGFFQGVMDESRIWDVARTASQIQATKNDEVKTAAGLIGRWGMNEGSGTLLHDSSGNGVDGTLTNGPTWIDGFTPPPPPPPAPYDPVLNAPADGATGVGMSPTLDVSVSDPGNGPLTVAFYGRPKASGVYQLIATNTNVPSGSSTSTTWSNIGAGQTFQWYVTVDNGSSATTGPTWTFKTADGADPVLVGAGDIAKCDSPGDEATGRIMEGIDGNVFTAGDNVYVNGTAQEFADCYDPSWGSFKNRTRPATGNHDWNTGTLNGYFGYYGANATDAGGKSYYSYDIDSRWHVTVLDTECAQAAVGGCVAGSPQEVWLRQDLAAHADDNMIVIWHKPRFSSGSTNLTELQAFYQDIYNAGADILLVGHDHVYERLAPMNPSGAADPTYGVRQFTVGMGGAEHHSFSTIRSTSQVRNNDTWGVIKFTLHADSYDWQFLPVDGATFTDSGTASTHDAPNGAPTAAGQTVTATEDTARTITLSGTDPDGDALTFAKAILPGNGSLGAITGTTCSGSPSTCTASVTYTPDANFHGSDSFTFTVSDGFATSAPAAVSITVASVNDAPTAAPESYLTDRDVALTVPPPGVLQNDSDVDGDALTAVLGQQAAHGVVSLSSNGGLTYTPAAGYTGSDSFTYRASDGTLSSTPATVSLTVTAVNRPPVIDSVSVTPTSPTTNQTLTANVTSHDLDNDPVTYAYQWERDTGTGFQPIAGAAGATLNLSVAGNGDRGDRIRVVVTPNDGTVNGTAATSAPVTVTDTAPSATVSLDNHSPGTNATLTATATGADVDGDTVRFTYAWKVNGTTVKTTSLTTSITDTLDLSQPGNGDTGQTVSVTVTPNDGTLNGTAVSDSAVVQSAPPAAPTGVVITITPTSAELDWANNTEANLSGYNVYRSSAAGGPFTKLNGSLLTTSAFSDGTAPLGTSYYRITAVNTSSQESAPATANATRKIDFRGAATAATRGATSITIARPGSTASGDVLIAMVDVRNAPTLTPPAGWTLISDTPNGTTMHQLVYWKPVGESEPASYTWTLSSSQASSGAIVAYRGVDPAAPIEATAAQTAASSKQIVAPSLTSAYDGGVIIGLYSVAQATTIAPPNAMFERGEAVASGKAKLTGEVSDATLQAAGSTGARTAVATKTGANIGQLLLLRPAGG